MGRKILTSAAIAAATLGVAAGSAAAAAPSATTLSNGTKLTHAAARAINRSMHKAVTTNATGTAKVVNHGNDAECTVPETAKNGGYENFFTRDTTNYLEFTGSVLVGDCSADLNDPQHIATSNDKPGPLGQVIIPKTYMTYSEECNILYKGHNFKGDAESIVYPDGEFTETCIAPVIIT